MATQIIIRRKDVAIRDKAWKDKTNITTQLQFSIAVQKKEERRMTAIKENTVTVTTIPSSISLGIEGDVVSCLWYALLFSSLFIFSLGSA